MSVTETPQDLEEYRAAAEAALPFADPMALRGLLYQLTGDKSLSGVATTLQPGMFAGEMAAVADPAEVEVLQRKMLDVLVAMRAGDFEPVVTTPDQLRTAMELGVGDAIPDEDLEFWREELSLDPNLRGLVWDHEPDPERLAGFHVVVIGAGLAGVNAAIRLKAAGLPFTVLDKNEGVGGTWFANTYPGARVDVPSRAYSHTFAVDYPFTHLFAPQPENEEYINWCVDTFGVRDRICLGVEVVRASWDDAGEKWRIETRGLDGTTDVVEASAIISAVGFMDRPKHPSIEGLERFRGPIFHTASWDHSVDLAGKRVAVIGTGASGCQLVPDLAPIAEQITVFQRTPPWFIGIPGYRFPLPEPMLWLDRNVPHYTNWFRLRTSWALADRNFRPLLYKDPDWPDPVSISPANHAVLEHLSEYIRQQVGDDPELLAKCLPDYPPFAKRFVVDNGWFDALKRDNVTLNSERIVRVTETSVETAEGALEFDVIVLATGFHATDYLWPMEIVGRGGVSIADRWSTDGARAYWGTMVPGFPNFFMLYGPNTNAFANGPVVWGELQTRFALEWIAYLIANHKSAADVTPEAYDAFNVCLDERLTSTVWLDPRQKSYYTNDAGRVVTNGPWSTEEYFQAIRRPVPEDFEII
ncbi:MAG: 4-hydroxyacetophenone monooxygenase [Chloroflexota bacterium]|jgi:4-hydroxyacetophenone monooxygenase|nr:4-hydroxyacetophenone monooxygenase [Chloroflexota bacterium]